VIINKCHKSAKWYRKTASLASVNEKWKSSTRDNWKLLRARHIIDKCGLPLPLMCHMWHSHIVGLFTLMKMIMSLNNNQLLNRCICGREKIMLRNLSFLLIFGIKTNYCSNKRNQLYKMYKVSLWGKDHLEQWTNIKLCQWLGKWVAEMLEMHWTVYVE
jgi:hypothetical protein